MTKTKIWQGFSRVPPAAKLAAAFRIDDATARKIRRVLRGEIDPCGASPATATWVRDCYNDPSLACQSKHAADRLLKTHGIEAIWREGDGDDPRDRPLFEYCNAGDSYAPTLVFVGGRVEIATWGDMVESMERRGIQTRQG